MPADLFYFISSLPTLRWGEKPPFSYEDFMAKCRTDLGADIADCLEKLRLVPLDDVCHASDTGNLWHDFEAYIRNNVAEIRQVKLRRGASMFVHRNTPRLSPGDRKRVEEIMALQSPKERELALDKMRWQYLDELSAGHFFDIRALEVYTLRLLLQNKQTSWQPKAGRAVFTQILEKGFAQAREKRVNNGQ